MFHCFLLHLDFCFYLWKIFIPVYIAAHKTLKWGILFFYSFHMLILFMVAIIFSIKTQPPPPPHPCHRNQKIRRVYSIVILYGFLGLLGTLYFWIEATYRTVIPKILFHWLIYINLFVYPFIYLSICLPNYISF